MNNPPEEFTPKKKNKTKKKCLDTESNYGPSDLQSDALPTELSRRIFTATEMLFMYHIENLRLINCCRLPQIMKKILIK